MGVPASDQNKMLSHNLPAPDTSVLFSHSRGQEKYFLGIEDKAFPSVSQKGNTVQNAMGVRV